MAFDAGGIAARAELSLAQFEANLATALSGLQRLDAAMQQVRSAKVTLDSQGLKQQTEAARAQIEALSKTAITPKVDTAALEGATREFSTLRLRLSDLANPAGALSANFGAIGVGASAAAIAGVTALAAIGVGAVKAAAEIEQAVANVKSIAPSINTTEVTRALGDMSTRVAQSSTQLARSLYDVFSSVDDVSQATALNLVEVFGRGAVAAMTDAQTFGTAIVGVLNAYKLNLDDATHISDVFFNTVKAGVVTGDELARSLGPATAAAHAAGISFEELGALIAGVTKEGGPAAQNINNLVNLMTKLVTPETVANFAQLNVQIANLDGSLRDPLDVLTDLRDRLGELAPAAKAAALQQIFPDLQARQGAQVVISQLDFIRAKLKENQEEAGSTAAAYKTMAETAASNAVIFGNAWTALLQELGGTLLPLVTAAAQGLTAGLGALRTGVQGLSGAPGLDELHGQLDAVAAAVERLGPLLGALVQQADEAGNAIAAALHAVATPSESGGPRGLIPQFLDASGIGPAVQAYAAAVAAELRQDLQANIDTNTNNVDLSKALLRTLAPGALEAAAGPTMATFQAFLRAQGGETGKNFADGVRESELSHATADAVRQNEPKMREALATLAAAGISGGKDLIAAFEQGIEEQSPDLFQHLADVKEGIAGQLRDLLATAPDPDALTAGTQETLDRLEGYLRLKFPEIGDLTVELIRAQVIDRGNKLFGEAGTEFGKALTAAMLAGVQKVPAAPAEILQALPLETQREQVIKTSVDPESIANLLRLKQTMTEATQAAAGLNDKQAAGAIIAELNSAAFGRNAGAIEHAAASARAAAAEQAVLGDRYNALTTAALPSLTAAQAALVKQFQAAHDPATAAALAVQLVGGSAAAASQALAGTGADFARYVQGLQRLAESADPVASAHRLIEASAKSALTGIAAGLSAADRAWLEYRAARTTDAQAFTELATHLGIDPERVQAALAKGGQAFADLQAQMQRVVATADPVAAGTKLIEESAKGMLTTLSAGLPAADRAWLQYRAAREGDRTVLRDLYARMGGDLAAFDRATEAQQQRSIARMAQARSAAEVFHSTGRLLPAQEEPDLLGRAAQEQSADRAQQRQRQDQDLARAAARQLEDVGVAAQRLSQDRAQQAATFQQQAGRIDADFATRAQGIQATLTSGLQAIDHSRGSLFADFARTVARQQEDFQRTWERQQRDFAQADAESLRGFRESAGDALVGAASQFHAAAANAVEGLLGLSGDALRQAAAGVVDQFAPLSDAAQQASQQVVDAQTTMLEKIRDTFQSINSQAADTIKGIRDGLLQSGQLGNTPALFQGIFQNLPGQGSPEQQAALKATEERTQAILAANLKQAEVATKQQEILTTAQKARDAIDKANTDAEKDLQKQILDQAKQARDQRKQMIEQLARQVEAFQRSAFTTAQGREDQRIDQGTAEGRQAEDQARALGQAITALNAQMAAAGAAAAEATRANQAQRDREALALQEQERQARLQQQRQDQDLARQAARAAEDRALALMRLQQDREREDRRRAEEIERAREQVRQGDLLDRIAHQLERGAGVEQNFDMREAVFVEPATELLEIAARRFEERVAARTAG